MCVCACVSAQIYGLVDAVHVTIVFANRFSSHSVFGSQAPVRHTRPDPVPAPTTGSYSGYNKGHKRFLIT